MISERDLAEKFSTIWKENLPLLTPSYIKFFNEIDIVHVNSPVIEKSEEIRYDFVAQLAFNCADVIFNKVNTFNDIFKDKNLYIKSKETAQQIWRDKFVEADLKLSMNEYKDCQEVCKNTLNFLKSLKSSEVKFRPKFQGYGLIPNLEGDISTNDMLIEIKTVKRNFRASDLKQLLIYLALQQMSGNSNWSHACLYNPRKGIYHKFNVKNTIYRISGGKSSTEVFKTLLDGFTRDINIDTRF